MPYIDEIWITDFGNPYPSEPASRRPAVVLGPLDFFGSDFPIAIVAPLTTSHRGLDLHVEVPANRQTGLRETGYVQCELLRSVNSARLSHRLGVIDVETSWHVSEIVGSNHLGKLMHDKCRQLRTVCLCQQTCRRSTAEYSTQYSVRAMPSMVR